MEPEWAPTYSLAIAEAGSIEVAAPALEEHRPGLIDAVRATPYLTRFPGSFDPSPFATTIRYREPSEPATRNLPDWWDGSDAPLIYMTFGTVLGFMSIAADVYRTALDAVSQLDVRVVLTVGHRFHPADLGAAPPNAHVEPWVAQADVLGVADLVVCHGGSGTVLGALAAGVPMVVVPVFADQSVNAHQVVACGAGMVVQSETEGQDCARHVLRRADVSRIADAIAVALDTPSLRQRAAAVADEMRAAPLPDGILPTLVDDPDRST